MAPQQHIPVAANVLGTIGTICWCVQLVPQAWSNWRKKDTEGLPSLMIFLWAVCCVPFGVYVVVQNFNVPLQVQPQVFGALALVNWVQVMIYSNGWSAWKASLIAVLLAAVFAGAEAALILTLRVLVSGPYSRGVSWPILLIGIISAVLLAAGLIPPYWEIWKRNGRVVGINFLFLTIDFSGAFFSLMALVAQQTFDPLGGSLYIACLTLELGIFVCQAIFLFRTRKLRKQAKLDGKKFDDLPEARAYQDTRTRKEPGANEPCDGDVEMQETVVPSE